MIERFFIPFLKWGECQSKTEKKPDILEIQVLETEPFETEFNISIRTKVDGNEVNVPLHNFDSANWQLIDEWSKAVKKGKIRKDKKFKIKTWLGISRNGYPIRRFEFIF
jgi:hypothetical protein